MTERVKTHVRSLQTDMCLILGGLTSQVQPADVSWNKPFKVAYRELYNQWMSSGEKAYTAAGNLKAPDKLLCLEWVKQAWKTVTTEVVVNFFKACGISNNTDGSEDDWIHCMKPGEVAHSAANTVATETARLQSSQPNASDDPFTDLEAVPEEEERTINDK